MPHLKWYDSPHWAKPSVIIEEPELELEAELPAIELPPALTLRTRHEIIDAIRDDPRYNATNPSNQQHIIDIAIAEALNNGTLIPESQGELVNA